MTQIRVWNAELLYRKKKCCFNLEFSPQEDPALAEVLADQLNVLTILGTGKVEFLLDQLDFSATRRNHAHSDVTSRVKPLQALTGLAADESCRREILSRGEVCVTVHFTG